MKQVDFSYLQDFMEQETGVVLTDDKNYLFETRLDPVLKERGFNDIHQLITNMRTLKDPALSAEVIHAMTTHESFFFRDGKPFIHFEKHVVPDLIEKNTETKSIRIWCAACSNGQEPYSLSMILDRKFRNELQGWNVQIYATDISEKVLVKARNGIYSDFEVRRGLHNEYLEAYFHKVTDRQWRIDEKIIDSVTFEVHNLLNTFHDDEMFDVIFCRNVLIYFDTETKKFVLRRMSDSLANHGYLYLGGAETPYGLSEYFDPENDVKGVYRLNK